MAGNGSALAAALAARLDKRFGPNDLEWKLQSSGVKGDGEIWGLCVPYISARACTKRLDEVFGFDGWDVKYREIQLGEKIIRDRNGTPVGRAPLVGVVATLTVRVGDAVIVREDGAEPTDVEPVKGGISGAFKRVCVTLGIGRYLYDAEPSWAVVSEKGLHRGNAKAKDGSRHNFRWDPPREAVAKLTAGHNAPDVPVTNPPAETRTPPATNGAPATNGNGAHAAADAPTCPKCGGSDLQDDRAVKRNPRAPDFVCKKRGCNGKIWPPRTTVPANNGPEEGLDGWQR